MPFRTPRRVLRRHCVTKMLSLRTRFIIISLSASVFDSEIYWIITTRGKEAKQSSCSFLILCLRKRYVKTAISIVAALTFFPAGNSIGRTRDQEKVKLPFWFSRPKRTAFFAYRYQMQEARRLCNTITRHLPPSRNMPGCRRIY
jgi:hypothetical protein